MHEQDEEPGKPEDAIANPVVECLRARRTIARFSDQAVAPAVLFEAIAVARWAPNHLLSEPWFFYVLGPEAVAATIETTFLLAAEKKGEEMGHRKARRASNVPAWVVVTSQRSDDIVRQREDYAATSCAIHNFSLVLWTQGIGMKWCTGALVEDRRYYERLGIDFERELMVGILRIGYPHLIPSQKRKSVDEISVLLD